MYAITVFCRKSQDKGAFLTKKYTKKRGFLCLFFAHYAYIQIILSTEFLVNVNVPSFCFFVVLPNLLYVKLGKNAKCREFVFVMVDWCRERGGIPLCYPRSSVHATPRRTLRSVRQVFFILRWRWSEAPGSGYYPPAWRCPYQRNRRAFPA